MVGNGFGVAWLCLMLSLFSWDLSGSSQALNLNLCKILGILDSLHSSGCEEYFWELLTLHGSDAFGCRGGYSLTPLLHPPPASTWKMPHTQGPAEGPLSIAHSLGPQDPRQVFYHVFVPFSLSGHHFPPLGWQAAPRALRGQRSRSAGGCRAAGRDDGRRCSSTCQDASACVFLVVPEVVCAVPGMIQCSWRRCKSSLRAHALLSAGSGMILVIPRYHCPKHHCNPLHTAVGPYLLPVLHKQNFSAVLKPPLCTHSTNTTQGWTELLILGGSGKQLTCWKDHSFSWRKQQTPKFESPITHKQLEPFHPIPVSCSAPFWHGLEL